MNTHRKTSSLYWKKIAIRQCFLALAFLHFHPLPPSSSCYHCLFYFFDLCWFLNIATFLLFLLFPAIFLYPFLSLCLFLPLVFVCLVLLSFVLFFCKNNRFEVSIWMLKDILKYQFKMSTEELENFESPFESAKYVTWDLLQFSMVLACIYSALPEWVVDHLEKKLSNILWSPMIWHMPAEKWVAHFWVQSEL